MRATAEESLHIGVAFGGLNGLCGMGALVVANRTVAAAEDDPAGFIEIRGEILGAARPAIAAGTSPESMPVGVGVSGSMTGRRTNPIANPATSKDNGNDDGFRLHHDDETRLTANPIMPDSLAFCKEPMPRNRMK